MGAYAPGVDALRLRSPARALWLAVAAACLGVGMAGVVLPLLPTTPFLLVAAYAASRSSSRLHAWLLGHRFFGETIRHWHEHRSVARRAKLAASGTMAASAAVLFLVSRAPLAGAATALMALVGIWLWLRPEPPAP